MLDGQNTSDGRKNTSSGVAALAALGQADERGAVEQEQAPEPDERVDEEPAEPARAGQRVDQPGEVVDEAACPGAGEQLGQRQLAPVERLGDLGAGDVVATGVAAAVQREGDVVPDERGAELHDQGDDDQRR